MRVSRVGPVLVAAALLSGQPALAELAGPSGGRTMGPPLEGFGVVFLLGLIGCLVVSVGTILAARAHRRRREMRHPCSLSVRLEPGAGSPVRLVDISRRGARLRTILPPLPGAKVEVHWEDVALEATVIWSGEVFAGLRFRNTLPKRTMARMIAASPARSGRATGSDWATPGLGV